MTVSTATSRNSYNGNAATDTFAYTFRILDEAHVAVYVDDVLQTITTHYTVTGVGNSGGGDIVFTTPPATGTLNVVFIRSVPATQETDYVENDPFPAAAHEDALDKLTMLVQQTDEKHSRTPKFAVTSSTSDITFPEPSADEFIGWNTAGDDLENKTIASISAITLPVSITNGGTGQTTASAAISALGGVAKAGDSMTGLLGFKKGADIASAATVDLGTATGNTVDVTHSTGTTAITSLGGASLQAGTEIETRFVITGGTLTITHHATNLYLAGGVNIPLTNGDVIRWRKMHSSNAEWKMVGGVKADGTAWVGSNSFSVIDAAGDLIVGTSDNTAGRLAIGTGLQQLRVNAGATALEWATIASSGGLLAVTTFTGNGTWNKSTNNPSKIMVMAVGGGGAGGGTNTTNPCGATGGEAGAVNWAYTASPASSYSITIGAGGTGVVGGTGNTGSSTTVGALLTALGGYGGKLLEAASTFLHSLAGASCLRQGGAGRISDGVGNSASANTGAGGGGALTIGGATQRAGGAGGSGLVIIWEFA